MNRRMSGSKESRGSPENLNQSSMFGISAAKLSIIVGVIFLFYSISCKFDLFIVKRKHFPYTFIISNDQV